MLEIISSRKSVWPNTLIMVFFPCKHWTLKIPVTQDNTGKTQEIAGFLQNTNLPIEK